MQTDGRLLRRSHSHRGILEVDDSKFIKVSALFQVTCTDAFG
jgi:hypothetical protein